MDGLKHRLVKLILELGLDVFPLPFFFKVVHIIDNWVQLEEIVSLVCS